MFNEHSTASGIEYARSAAQAAVSKADHTPPLLEHNSTIAIIATNTATRLKVKLKFCV